MIKSFKHKGPQKFYEDGSHKTIQPEHIAKLARILDRLDASIEPQDMRLPGFKLHKLSGKEKGTWSVWISGTWRVTFQFKGENAVKVDYTDYH
jgi:proteic killer suppression protein